MKWHMIFCVLLLQATVNGRAAALSFHRYHTWPEIQNYLARIATDHPEDFTLETIGLSREGRPLLSLTLRGIPGAGVIQINSTHHGNELIATESALAVIDFLQKNRRQPAIVRWRQKFALTMIPVVNPDGLARHSRYDAKGFDLNRDYAFPERSEDHSFRSPEIRALKEAIDRQPPAGAIAFHAGMESVLWPWCFTAAPNPAQPLFERLANLTATAMGFSPPRQSYLDYASAGEFIDYVYMKHQSLALTVEVSTQLQPNERDIAAIVRNAVRGTVAFVEGLWRLNSGSREVSMRLNQGATGH